MYKVSKDTPIPEIKLIFLAFIFLDITYILYLATPLFSSPNLYNPEMVIFDRLGYFTSIFALILIAYSFIIPNFQSNYESILSIIIIDFSFITCAIYNSITLEVTVIDEFIDTSYTVLGTILVFIFYFLLIFFLVKRIREIIKILGKDYSSPFTSMKFIIFFTLWVISIISVYSFTQFLTDLMIPQYTYNILISIFFLYAVIATTKDKAFFFVTPASLDAIIVMEQYTGLVLHSKSFKKDLLAEELLSNVFQLLDISLQEALRSKSKLKEISFGDKSVIINNGTWVSTAMIVSEVNFVTRSSTKYLTEKFEKMYQNPKNEEPDSMISIEHYLKFQEIINEIRPYVPL